MMGRSARLDDGDVVWTAAGLSMLLLAAYSFIHSIFAGLTASTAAGCAYNDS